MEDEAEIAENLADTVKGLGIRKYLWLYFFIVPLAAATASCVAVAIAALQGLSTHPLALQIYARVVLASAKTVLVFGAAYAAGVLLATLTGAIQVRVQAKHRTEFEQTTEGGARRNELLKLATQRSLREGMLLRLSAVYAAFFCLFGIFYYSGPDVLFVYDLLEQIANMTTNPL